MCRTVRLFALALVIVAFFAPPGTAQFVSPLTPPQSTALRTAFASLCAIESSSGREPRVCKRGARGGEAISDAERYYTMAALQRLGTLPASVSAAFNALHQSVSAVQLRYLHRDGRWQVAAGEREIDWDANGVPTVARSPHQLLAVAVEETNPLLYTAAEGEVKEEAIPEAKSIANLFTVLGGGLAQVVSVATAASGFDGLSGVRALDPGLGAKPQSVPGRGRTSASLPPPPPPPPIVPDPGVAALLALLDDKRARWNDLRAKAEELQAALDALAVRRVDAILAIQQVETGQPPAWPSARAWTTTALPSVPGWQALFADVAARACGLATLSRVDDAG